MRRGDADPTSRAATVQRRWLAWWGWLALCAACRATDDLEQHEPRSASPDNPHNAGLERAFSLDDGALRLVRVQGRTPLADLAASSQASTFLLAVNAGFFDAELRPVGLASSDGRELAAFDATLGGGVLWTSNGVAHLTAAEEFHQETFDFALPARPRLVVQGRNNIKRDDGIRAARTALCLRRGGREVIVMRRAEAGAGPSLHSFALELVGKGCEEALNLDGGPSAAWASAEGMWLEPHTPIAMVVVVERKP